MKQYALTFESNGLEKRIKFLGTSKKDVGKKPWLLFLHGFSVGGEKYLNFLEKFERSYNIICPRINGINDFDDQPRTRHEALDITVDFLEELNPHVCEVSEKFDPEFVMGHSMGGSMAIDMTTREEFDFKGSIAINPVMPTSYGYNQMAIKGVKVGYDAYSNHKTGFESSYIGPYLRNMIKKPFAVRDLVQDLNNYNYQDRDGNLLEITTPSLTIFSKKDQLFGDSLTKKTLSTMDDVFLNGYDLIKNNHSHDYPLAHPDQCAKECKDWMRKIKRRK